MGEVSDPSADGVLMGFGAGELTGVLDPAGLMG